MLSASVNLASPTRCSPRSSEADYLEPTPVQAGIIPHALAGARRARPGPHRHRQNGRLRHSDLECSSSGGKGDPPQALVLVPTRELAVQVRDEFDKLAHGRHVASVPIYGGKPIRGQIAKLQRGADVVIGTPGRVIDLIGRGSLDLRSLQIVVLDEADRMLDIGFRPDIEKILRRCPKERQTLLLEPHGRPTRRTARPHNTCATRKSWISRRRPSRSTRSSSSTSPSIRSRSSTCWSA